MMDWEVEAEPAKAPRKAARAQVGSGRKGRPVAEIVARLEQRDPVLAKQSGLSSAAMRAGDLVRSIRQTARLSQAALARKVGVSQARISEIEAGAGPQGPTWDVMERVFTACGASVTVIPGLPQRSVSRTGSPAEVEAIAAISVEETSKR